MSSPDWQDLERLWQSSSEAAQAKELIIRIHRRAWLRHLNVAFEVLMLLGGFALAIFLMVARPDARLGASVLLVFTLITTAFSIWARRVPNVSAEQSVTAALDSAIHRVRVRARLALANLWVLGFAMLACAIFVIIWAQADTYTTRKIQRYLYVCVYWFAISGVIQLCTIPYYLRRARELQRLEDLRRGLKDAP